MTKSEVQRYVYKHDNGPFDAELEIERLPYDGKFYRFEIRCTDPTDHERLMQNVRWAFAGNPTFQERERPRRW